MTTRKNSSADTELRQPEGSVGVGSENGVLFGYLEISGIPLQLGAVPGTSQRGYIDRANRSNRLAIRGC